MEPGGWIEVSMRSMQNAYRCFANATGSQVIEFEGGLGVINVEVRERSIFNGVVYLDPAGLAGAYDRLAAAYAEAGCSWTVWMHESDRSSADLLDAKGHTLDGKPRAMGRQLEGVKEPELSAIDWTPEGDPEQMGALNDAAYEYRPGTWIQGMGRHPEGQRTYLARLDGRPAATVSAIDRGGDCAIWHVATAPEARGQGLATALMQRTIFDAAQRGCETSTLQATKMGAPVYRRCGYEDLGGLEIWESRPTELAAEAHPTPHA